MSSALDLSLDDIIATNKSKGGRGGGKAKQPRGLQVKNKPAIGKKAGRGNAGPSARAVAMAIDQVWQHDKFPGQGVPMVNVSLKGGNAAGGAAQDTGAKLLVSNLHFNVTQQDVKELFAMCGAVKKASVNFDQAGRSKGTAEVIFARRADALTAQQRYNGATLDGMPMRIELVASALAPGASVLSSGRILGGAPAGGRGNPGGVSRTVTLGSPGGVFARAAGALRDAGAPGRGRSSAGRGRGRGRGGRGRGRSDAKPRSAEDLDNDLDSYKQATMQE